MRTSAYLNHKVLEGIYDFIGKNNNPIVSAKLINLLANSDCYLPDGYWNKHKLHPDMLRRITAKGRIIHNIKKEHFFESLNKSNHFAIGITKDEVTENILTTKPFFSVSELIQLMDEYDRTSFFIREERAIYDFLDTSLPQNPSSVIVNDRYFFKNGSQEKRCTIY